MTTRTLLITVPGSDDPEACGECPFLEASWHMGAPDGEVCTLPGRTVIPVSAGLRHAACLAAERAAPAARSRLREVHEHITERVLPALERMDKEDGNG